MGGADPRLSGALTAHASVVAALRFAHALRARGLRRTLLFAALGSAIPFLGELLAIKILRLLRHRVRPRVGGVPVAVALGWYNVGYNAFVVMEHLLARAGLGADGGARCGAGGDESGRAARPLRLGSRPVGVERRRPLRGRDRGP